MLQARMEKPSQRLHYRVTAPLRIAIDDVEYIDPELEHRRLLRNEIEGPDRQGPASSSMPRSPFPFQGFDISFDLEAQVVRFDAGHAHGPRREVHRAG